MGMWIKGGRETGMKMRGEGWERVTQRGWVRVTVMDRTAQTHAPLKVPSTTHGWPEKEARPPLMHTSRPTRPSPLWRGGEVRRKRR
jgi:hypothetical protein